MDQSSPSFVRGGGNEDVRSGGPSQRFLGRYLYPLGVFYKHELRREGYYGRPARAGAGGGGEGAEFKNNKDSDEDKQPP